MKHSYIPRTLGSCRHVLLLLALFGTGLMLCAATARAQVSGSMPDTKGPDFDLFRQGPDSTQLEYFPLQVGNIWEYRKLSGGMHATSIRKDTVFANGYRYFSGGYWMTSSGHYLRIDSLLRVVFYRDESCESRYPGVLPWEDIPDGFSYYHLDEPVGKTWWVCEDNLGVLTNDGTIVKYVGTGLDYILGEWRDVKYFRVGLMIDQDTSYVFTCALARNLGIVFEEWELDNMTLVGARINGQVYGTITLDIDSPPTENDILTIDHSYPNPASTEAHIGFSVSQPATVDMDVYDMRGVCVKTLERQTQTPGSYVTALRVSDLASGSYYCRIRATSGARTVAKHVLLSIIK